MSAWRVIATDTESMTGVAPECESDAHGRYVAESGMEGDGAHWVFDCCPHPHIETYGEVLAVKLAQFLNNAGAEVCS